MSKSVTGNITKMVEEAYRLIPPPLSAFPAKYSAPISLLVHSLSAGVIANELAWLTGLDEEIAFYLALAHDIHQKLVNDGLTTMKSAKEYLRKKLDEAGKHDYYRYIEDAIEIDACGKHKEIRGLDKEVSLICHISDMAQGRFEGLELLYWLRARAKELDKDLTVRFYSVLIPQVVGRSYIIRRIYEKHIKGKDHVALASPWGLLVIGYEDDVPEVIEASWDDLRIEKGTEPIEYKAILDSERKVRGSKKDKESEEKTSDTSTTINKIRLSRDELREGLWSRFARMFYDKESLYVDGEKKQRDSPMYPVFPEDVRGLFVNIEFTDVEFRNIGEENVRKCNLCGLPHLQEHSININMFGKIAGVEVTAEKWNRFMKTGFEVRGKEQWRSGVGICPLCTVEAIAIRESKFTGAITGVLSVSISRPIPVSLLEYLGRILAESHSLEKPIVGGGSSERLVLDYSSATIGTQEVAEPSTENLFKHDSSSGVFTRIGKLISWGIYPVKFLPSFDTSIVDRPVITPYNFRVIDFPVTDREYSSLLPWIGSLLEVLGGVERSEGLKYLDLKPEHASLALLTINKSIYDEVLRALSSVGVRA